MTGRLRRMVRAPGITVATAVLAAIAVVAPVSVPSGPAALAAARSVHVQPAGDGDWARTSAPKPTSFAWKAPAGRSAPIVKPDPHAKRMKELTSRRTANASFFQMSDGSVQEELSAVPVHYRDAKGAWQDINSSVKPVSHDGFTAGAVGNAFQAYFSPHASSLVRIEQGTAFVQLGADGAATSAPKISGSTVTYPGAYPGTDIRYQAGPDGVIESIVLARAPAAGASFSFTLKLSGLTPKQLPDGVIGLYGGESADPAFVIPAPYMADSKADVNSPYGTAYSTKVAQSASWSPASGTIRLTVTPDASWLADAHRQYPVTIDPTILVSPTPSQAANVMILADGATTNYATSWRLSVGTTTTGAARALIRFPMPSVPAGTTISSADLKLYYDQTFTTGSNTVPLQALAANAAWNPATATWSNASSIGGPVAGTASMAANALDVWNDFKVTSTVQAWVNGTLADNGFVLKAASESTLGQGGPRYEGSIYAYGGEVVNYPKLVITYGVPGVAVNPPAVIHSTGAELSWPAYVNTTGNPDNDLAEYQVHRSVFQTFTPSASTEISPIRPGTTNFTDSTAVPTPANNSDPYGNAYYYMVVVKTKSGALIPGPTTLVRLPEAGRTTLIIPAQSATTLSSAQPNAVLNTLSNAGTPQPWLEVGDNSAAYGTARAVFGFGALSAVPSGSTILDAHLKLWQETTTTNTSGAVYQLHALTRPFTGSQVTWNSAATGTAWTTVGGDFSAITDGTASGLTNDPNRQNLDATSIVQGWINTPSSDDGLLVKLATESGKSPQEHTIFAGPATAESALAPALVVTYLDNSTGSTYYAPSTPSDMVPGTTYSVPVTVNNTTAATWSAASEVLTYHWLLPDGTDITTPADQLQTALPSDLAPAGTVTLNAQVTPPTPTDGNQAEGATLAWDMYNKATGTYLSAGTASAARVHAARTLASSASTNNGVGSLSQAIGVEEPGSNELGLENFYQYATTATGSDSSLYTNMSSGNTVWNYNAFTNPSRGFATFVRMSYNSLDTTDTTTGFGWSVQASTPTRLGSPLDFHPNPNPTEVTFVDGDGTSHVFTWNSGSSTWTSPPGVHLYLQQLASCGPQVTNARAWKMTRPDRTQFFYDCEGYPTSVVDKNGNEADFTYTQRNSENKPEEFLTYITDPTGRQTLNVAYYAKGDSYSYDDGTGNLVADTNLTNPAIIDHVKSITDIAGRTIFFFYTTKGLLAQMVDGYGNSAAKTFKFLYDATQGNKNVKLVQVTDPRGNATHLAYYDPSTDPKVHWWTQTITDRLGHATGFAYTEPGTIAGSAIQTTVTDARNNAMVYQLDSTGRPIQAVNPLGQKMTLGWDADNNVTSATEDNGATTTWIYDPNTGYPLSTKDAEANKNNTAATTYTYQTSLGGHIADITDKVSPAGRHWHFTYDGNGNLLTVQDPDGVAVGSGYTTSYTYDSAGDLQTVTDADNHTTTYSNYDPSGYPDTVKDPLGNVTTTAYGPRGEVTSTTDPLGHVSTQNYDIFLRPLDSMTPKDQANGVYITVPAPVYDANGNMVQSTAPNGAVTTATFDAGDELTASTDPPNSVNSPARTTTNTYDASGNLLTVTAPNGNLAGAAVGSYTSTYTYDALNRAVAVTDALGDKSTTTFDDVGNPVATTDPVKNATPGNTTASTQTAYDLDHRPVRYTDADGNVSSVAYDLDGNGISATDRNGNTTLYTYDPDSRITQVQVPHTSSGGTITYGTSQYVYDQVGNQTAVISPRGVASGIAGAFTAKTSYDADNRMIADFGAYDPSDPVYHTAPETDYSYDASGRLTQVSAPPSGGQAVRNITKYTYWDTGWTKSSTDPFGITTNYDYNELGQQTSRTLASAGGSSSRTQGWAYYPDGSLQSRTDNGVPVGLQVVMVDDSDIQNVAVTGAWQGSTSGTGFVGYDYQTHAAGTGSDSFTWNLTIPQDGTYQVYVQYPQVSGATTSAQYTIAHDGESSTQTVDQTQNVGGWVSLGSYSFTQAGSGQKISLAESPGGTVSADAVKLVRDNSKDIQPGPEAFGYAYDADGNLTQLTDSSPGALYDTYAYSYDGVDRLTSLQEELAGAVKHTTSFTYDPDSHPLSQNYDSSIATYTYDNRNLLQSVVNKESATDASPKTTSYTYTPTGQIATETKGNGNVVSYTYNLDDSQATQVEKTSGGTLVASDNYSYDPNGNPTQIVSSIQNADNHSAYLNRTATNTFTPQDQVASIANSDGNANQSYSYDQEGNITSQNIGGVQTTNTYDRNRLLTSDQNGTVGDYNYDPFGRLDTVTVGGTVEQRYAYDGYDRVTSEQQYSAAAAGLVTTSFVYDAFDRTVSQTESAGTSSAKTTTFDYLATSNALVGERVNGTLTKSYQFSPWGERLDQIVHNSDGNEDPTYYSYDAHTNVQAITDSSGNTKATYGYTAYGSADTSQSTGVDAPGAQPAGTAPYNDYRYTADRVDTSTGDYNMGFRNYDPSVNRFLSMDMYEGALADAGLSTDPYTGNRYAFAGGNPLSNIELDGHSWLSDHGFARFTVDSAGSVSDLVPLDALRDWYINETIRTTSATQAKGTYVAGYDPVTKRFAVGRSSPLGCAERDVARKLGLPMDQIYYSRAVQVLSGSNRRYIDVCRNCQNDSELTMYADGTKGYLNGRWDRGAPIHTDYATSTGTDLAIPDQTSKALVPISKPSSGGGGGGSTASDVAGAGADASRGGAVLRTVSTAFKWAGRGLMVLGIAADIYDVATAPSGQRVQTAVRDTTSLAGAWAGAEVGAEAGATIGTFVGGPVGTVVGGVVGGIVGGVVGGGLGEAAGNFLGSLF